MIYSFSISVPTLPSITLYLKFLNHTPLELLWKSLKPSHLLECLWHIHLILPQFVFSSQSFASNKMGDLAMSAGFVAFFDSYHARHSSWLCFPPPHRIQSDQCLYYLYLYFLSCLPIREPILTQSFLHTWQSGLFLFLGLEVTIPAQGMIQAGSWWARDCFK